jgi:putative acetyltransferase
VGRPGALPGPALLVDPRAGVIVTHRAATTADAPRLLELRRESILALAPHGMSNPEAEAWAANLTIGGMETKIREMDIWTAAIGGRVVGWGAVRGNRLEGLYTDPEFAGQGIGTELLGRLEHLMRTRGVQTVRADASANAEGFYLRRGYEPDGPLRGGGARPIRKTLPPAPC